jgi:hypothetical protein
MACEDVPSRRVSANGPYFVETVQKRFDEDDFSDDDVEVNCNQCFVLKKG